MEIFISSAMQILFISHALCQINIAKHKTTDQNFNAYEETRAELAVDGDMRTLGTKCAHATKSETERNAWWRVDLGRKALVSTVTVTSRMGSGIFGAHIMVGLQSNHKTYDFSGFTLCGTVQQNLLHYVNTVFTACKNPIPGRYVAVWTTGEHLVLCEVQVFEQIDDPNLALGKSAGPLNWKRPAHLAVDGNKNPAISENSCASDDKGRHWNVDLGEIYKISKVVITGRNQCCDDDFSRAYIFITRKAKNSSKLVCYGSYCARIGKVSLGVPKTVKFESSVDGRFIYIKTNGNKALTLCEVEVYGYKMPFYRTSAGHIYEFHYEKLDAQLAAGICEGTIGKLVYFNSTSTGQFIKASLKQMGRVNAWVRPKESSSSSCADVVYGHYTELSDCNSQKGFICETGAEHIANINGTDFIFYNVSVTQKLAVDTCNSRQALLYSWTRTDINTRVANIGSRYKMKIFWSLEKQNDVLRCKAFTPKEGQYERNCDHKLPFVCYRAPETDIVSSRTTVALWVALVVAIVTAVTAGLLYFIWRKWQQSKVKTTTGHCSRDTREGPLCSTASDESHYSNISFEGNNEYSVRQSVDDQPLSNHTNPIQSATGMYAIVDKHSSKQKSPRVYDMTQQKDQAETEFKGNYDSKPPLPTEIATYALPDKSERRKQSKPQSENKQGVIDQATLYAIPDKTKKQKRPLEKSTKGSSQDLPAHQDIVGSGTEQSEDPGRVSFVDCALYYGAGAESELKPNGDEAHESYSYIDQCNDHPHGTPTADMDYCYVTPDKLDRTRNVQQKLNIPDSILLGSTDVNAAEHSDCRNPDRTSFVDCALYNSAGSTAERDTGNNGNIPIQLGEPDKQSEYTQEDDDMEYAYISLPTEDLGNNTEQNQPISRSNIYEEL